jgi:mono/diheme cytochrome c family protein
MMNASTQTKLGAGLFVLAFAAGGLVWRMSLDRPSADPDNAAQVARGEKIYAAHCANCHGAKLQGQPDWMTRKADGRLPAPPHDQNGHTWHHSDDLLFGIVKKGVTAYANPGYQSDMPAYEGVLPDDDIQAVLAFIKNSWPKDIQDRQRAISHAARER